MAAGVPRLSEFALMSGVLAAAAAAATAATWGDVAICSRRLTLTFVAGALPAIRGLRPIMFVGVVPS